VPAGRVSGDGIRGEEGKSGKKKKGEEKGTPETDTWSSILRNAGISFITVVGQKKSSGKRGGGGKKRKRLETKASRSRHSIAASFLSRREERG